MSDESGMLRNIVKSEELYKGHILNLRIDTVRFPSGSDKVREVVVHKAAVAMLPVNRKGELLLVRQYRHAVDQDLFEIPAGLVEPGEDKKEAAIRELREETGFRPGYIEEIADFYSSPGYCTEVITVYFVSDLTESKLPEDDDEYIKVFAFTPEALGRMIAEGKIKDGKTLMAYYWYMARQCQRLS